MLFFDFICNLFKGKLSNDKEIMLSEISAVYQQLAIEGKNGAFAVFMPKIPRVDETEVLNIQFSIENGNIGLDWVLLSSINITNQKVFLAAAKSLCYQVESKQQNDVSYLRVEGEKSAIICQQLLANLYNLKNDDPVELIIEGFTWSTRIY